MQQSSLTRFCDECGLANDPAASHCAACQSPLPASVSASSSFPIIPVTIAPPPVLEVTPGPLLAMGGQSVLVQNQSRTGEFRAGTILDARYEILEEIGRGGFSAVYRASEIGGNRRTVAIKRIQLSKLSPRQVIDATETFNREITMLARFKGVKGIPVFYEHLTDAENWYLVMQYIEGQTLEEYLQKAPGGYLAEDETVQLSIELAEIVRHLHTLSPPVIFRDLKPANIMVTPKRELYLIDFGIARNFTPGKVKDTTPLGSPGYAPPEQYGRAQTDQQSDIYSLGATLQTMLTGRDPLELRAGEPSRNPKVPSRAMRKLLDEMLAPDPLQRPHNMAYVKRRLETLPAPRHPFLSYTLGLVAGAILSFALFLAMFVGFGWGSFYIGAYFPGILANIIWKRLRKKYRLPKADRWFFAFGALTLLVPALLILLWHSGWWPF